MLGIGLSRNLSRPLDRTWNEISYIIPHKPRHARMADILGSPGPKQRFFPFPSISLTATTKLLREPYFGADPCQWISFKCAYDE